MKPLAINHRLETTLDDTPTDRAPDLVTVLIAPEATRGQVIHALGRIKAWLRRHDLEELRETAEQ